MKNQQHFKRTSASVRIFWDQKVAALMKLPVFDDEENDELDNDVRSFVDETTHLTTAVLRRCVEMSRL